MYYLTRTPKKTLNYFFNDQFPEFDSYVLPGFRESDQDIGRPKAGSAQQSIKTKTILKQRLKCDNFRIQGQILSLPFSKLLYLNVYCPTDPGTKDFDDLELLNVLHDLENIIENSDHDDILLGGDLNWDPSRITGFADTMKRWTDKFGLISVGEQEKFIG